jgi:tetratricopeptide (TPR) repeat protein
LAHKIPDVFPAELPPQFVSRVTATIRNLQCIAFEEGKKVPSSSVPKAEPKTASALSGYRSLGAKKLQPMEAPVARNLATEVAARAVTAAWLAVYLLPMNLLSKLGPLLSKENTSAGSLLGCVATPLEEMREMLSWTGGRNEKSLLEVCFSNCSEVVDEDIHALPKAARLLAVSFVTPIIHRVVADVSSARCAILIPRVRSTKRGEAKCSATKNSATGARPEMYRDMSPFSTVTQCVVEKAESLCRQNLQSFDTNATPTATALKVCSADNFRLGQILFYRGASSEAVVHLRRAIIATTIKLVLNAHTFFSSSHRGGRLLPQPTQTQKALRARAALDGELAPIWHSLGMTLKKEGDPHLAILAYRNAVTARPSNAPSHLHMGIAYRLTGCFEKAVAAYTKAIRLSPCCADAHYNTGVTLGFVGDVHGSIQAYKQALFIDPKCPAYFNLALSLESRGDLVAAASAYLQQLALDPCDMPAHARLHQILRGR